MEGSDDVHCKPREGGAGSGESSKISADREICSAASDDDDLDAGVTFEVEGSCPERSRQPELDPIASLRPVQPNRPDPVGNDEFDWR
ncbi:hypothetical protein M2227_004389 [Bradyrhizobium elkanii]|nr:hypothetical protein [Bradyrhizobium elkanii]MCP1930774.1 hypothetical protein [Bradyrhizobium elkanii]MCP1982563.1 hypothetical protein [Bradyrhizobium elkanii]MCS3574444.1 hypothetical protein [Bradyrhizobium elkanii]MCS3592865.1 hypothetical protein [Bradyrhizobium elkanii]